MWQRVSRTRLMSRISQLRRVTDVFTSRIQIKPKSVPKKPDTRTQFKIGISSVELIINTIKVILVKYPRKLRLTECFPLSLWARSQSMWKVTIGFVMPVRPSAWSNSATTGRICYLSLFRKSVKKIQVSLKSDNNNWHFTWRHFHFYDNISLNSS
jgi:hypothetical protein